MIETYNVRTDLALEEKEQFERDCAELSGVSLEEEFDEENEIQITTVKIESENGAKAMGKPTGTYITIEAPAMEEYDENFHSDISDLLAEKLQILLPEQKGRSHVLVVGLGNRMITPDALGPYVVDNLFVTRHLVTEYGRYAIDTADIVSAIVPGVMGQTGMETVEIIRGVVSEIHPDYLVVIDALAARNFKRLNRTIQIADTGIYPGAGVGNHRHGITKETIGVPVLAIGIPTVIDAATIVYDSVDSLMEKLNMSRHEKYKFLEEAIPPGLNGMFVTPKDIDETVKRLSFTVSEGLNRLFFEQEE